MKKQLLEENTKIRWKKLAGINEGIFDKIGAALGSNSSKVKVLADKYPVFVAGEMGLYLKQRGELLEMMKGNMLDFFTLVVDVILKLPQEEAYSELLSDEKTGPTMRKLDASIREVRKHPAWPAFKKDGYGMVKATTFSADEMTMKLQEFGLPEAPPPLMPLFAALSAYWPTYFAKKEKELRAKEQEDSKRQEAENLMYKAKKIVDKMGVPETTKRLLSPNLSIDWQTWIGVDITWDSRLPGYLARIILDSGKGSFFRGDAENRKALERKAVPPLK